MIPTLSISLLAGALAVDNRSSVRLLISQPVCGGLLAGLVLGNARDGFMAGALLQMLFLGLVPVRGIALPDLPLAGVGGSALYVLALRSVSIDSPPRGIVLALSLLAALGIAVVGRILDRFWERGSYTLTALAARLVERGHFALAAALHFSSVPVHFGIGFALTAAALVVGVPAMVMIVGGLSAIGGDPLGALPVLLPFIGAGSLLALNLTRVRVALYLIGFCSVFVIMLFRG